MYFVISTGSFDTYLRLVAMKVFRDKQTIIQLEKRKGGYSCITLSAEVVNKFPAKKQTRFVCTVDKSFKFQCGLNHLGDGNFFIILGARLLKEMNRKPGDTITFELREDADPLGVPMPETLEALLEQDEELRKVFDTFTMGKKRMILHAISRIKSIDKQIENSYKLIRQLSTTGIRKK